MRNVGGDIKALLVEISGEPLRETLEDMMTMMIVMMVMM